MSVALIDYGSGNVHSAQKALETAGNYSVTLTSDPEVIYKASHIVLPGVGAFGDAISQLKSRDGLIEAIQEAALKQQKPFLGICVGMQLLAQ